MKVIYKKRVLEKINEARIEALNAQRKIEKILVTQAEFFQLLDEVSDFQSRPISFNRPTANSAKVYGILVEVENEDF